MGVGYSISAFWLGHRQQHRNVVVQLLICGKGNDHGSEHLRQASNAVSICYQKPFEELSEVRAPSGVIVHDLLDPMMLPNVGRVDLQLISSTIEGLIFRKTLKSSAISLSDAGG